MLEVDARAAAMACMVLMSAASLSRPSIASRTWVRWAASSDARERARSTLAPA